MVEVVIPPRRTTTLMFGPRPLVAGAAARNTKLNLMRAGMVLTAAVATASGMMCVLAFWSAGWSAAGWSAAGWLAGWLAGSFVVWFAALSTVGRPTRETGVKLVF